MEVCSIMSMLNVSYDMNSYFEMKFELRSNENFIKIYMFLFFLPLENCNVLISVKNVGNIEQIL